MGTLKKRRFLCVLLKFFFEMGGPLREEALRYARTFGALQVASRCASRSLPPSLERIHGESESTFLLQWPLIQNFNTLVRQQCHHAFVLLVVFCFSSHQLLGYPPPPQTPPLLQQQVLHLQQLGHHRQLGHHHHRSQPCCPSPPFL